MTLHDSEVSVVMSKVGNKSSVCVLAHFIFLKTYFNLEIMKYYNSFGIW